MNIDSNGEKNYKLSPIALKDFVHIMGFFIFLFCVFLIRVYIFMKEPKIFIDSVYGVVFFFAQVATVGKVVELYKHQDKFLSCLQLTNKLDELGRRIGGPFSVYKMYNAILIFLYTQMVFNSLVTIVPVWDYVESVATQGFFSMDALKLMSQFLNLTPVSLIMFVTVFLYNMFASVILQRLKNMNRYVLKVEVLQGRNRRFVMQALMFAIEFYDTLFKLTEELNTTFGFTMFCNITLEFLKVISVIISSKNSKMLKPHQVFVGIIFYSIGACMAIKICEDVKEEIAAFKRNITKIELAYFDQELAQMREMLQLQMLHNKIDLHAFGVYSINTHLVTLHIGMICALTLFGSKMDKL